MPPRDHPDRPALARATHPAPRHDWADHPHVDRVLAVLPASRRGLEAWQIAHRAGIPDLTCRDVLAWLVANGHAWTRGGYDHWSYEYLRMPVTGQTADLPGTLPLPIEETRR